MAENEYTQMQVIKIPRQRAIIDIGPPSFWLEHGRQRWLTEWHPWFGPHHMNKDGSVKDKQPAERSMFWRIAVWWKNQGAKVVDGVGQWQFPPREQIRYRIVGRHKLIAHDDGPDVLTMEGDWIHEWTGISGDEQ